MQGCFLILESYFQYFNTLSRVSDQGNLVHLLIEAIGRYYLPLVFLELKPILCFCFFSFFLTTSCSIIILNADSFLVGTAMLIFGAGLYVMFVGSKNPKDEALSLPDSNLFGLFSLKVSLFFFQLLIQNNSFINSKYWFFWFFLQSLPTWVEMRSVSQAKSKIGHAIMMILQVGMLEKFKNIPLATSLDLACFAGAVLFSSACIFLLSKLSPGAMEDRW